jgi:hypothetical protein
MARRAPRLALIHSPLVGPSAWRLTQRAINACGGSAIAVNYGGMTGPDWYDGATARIARAVRGVESIVLIVHSGAGAFIPGLVEELGDRAAGYILVDAVMPYPGRCWLDTAPTALATRLRALGKEGVLPPWDTWFGEGAIATILPDAALRAAFSADLPRVPWTYFEALAPEASAWRKTPAAYLQLSDACAADANQAAALGWSVRREALNHLAMLSHPDRLAAILSSMAHELVGD